MDFIFSFPMRVRDYECDIQGIVNNANYLHYLEVGRHEFIESRGVEFADLHRRGIDVVVAQAEIKFKRSLQPRDHFEVRVAVEKRGLRYTFHQEIVRSADPLRAATDTSYAKPVLCIRAQTDIVAIVDGRLSDCAELNENFDLCSDQLSDALFLPRNAVQSFIMSDFIDEQFFTPSRCFDFQRPKGLFHPPRDAACRSLICHKIIIFA